VASIKFTNPHWEALTPETQSAFRMIGSLPLIQRFYLAGGSGLALHLGHRFSVDLDFFSTFEDAVNLDERTILLNELADPTFFTTYDNDGTFVASWRNVGISFFRMSVYPLALSTLLLEGVPVASLPEIGAMKLAAIIDRGTRKDMVDLFFILKQVPLEELFRVASIKYPHARTFAISASRALAYFVDAESLPMPQMLDHTSWKTMKRFLELQAIEVGRKNLVGYWE